MIVERLNPPSLVEFPGAVQVTVASGARSIHVSGQTGVDKDGNLVGPTHRAQTMQAMRNLHEAVLAAGATDADIASVTIYVVDYSSAVLEELLVALAAFAEEVGHEPLPTAGTLVGVSALWRPGVLVEISAVAVV